MDIKNLINEELLLEDLKTSVTAIHNQHSSTGMLGSGPHLIKVSKHLLIKTEGYALELYNTILNNVKSSIYSPLKTKKDLAVILKNSLDSYSSHFNLILENTLKTGGCWENEDLQRKINALNFNTKLKEKIDQLCLKFSADYADYLEEVMRKKDTIKIAKHSRIASWISIILSCGSLVIAYITYIKH